MASYVKSLLGYSAEQLAQQHKQEAIKKIQEFKPSDLTTSAKRMRRDFLQNPDNFTPEQSQEVLEEIENAKQWKNYLDRYRDNNIINANGRLFNMKTIQERTREMQEGPERLKVMEKEAEEKRKADEQLRKAQLDLDRAKYRENILEDIKTYQQLNAEAQKIVLDYVEEYKSKPEDNPFPDIWKNIATKTNFDVHPAALKYALEKLQIERTEYKLRVKQIYENFIALKQLPQARDLLFQYAYEDSKTNKSKPPSAFPDIDSEFAHKYAYEFEEFIESKQTLGSAFFKSSDSILTANNLQYAITRWEKEEAERQAKKHQQELEEQEKKRQQEFEEKQKTDTILKKQEAQRQNLATQFANIVVQPSEEKHPLNNAGAPPLNIAPSAPPLSAFSAGYSGGVPPAGLNGPLPPVFQQGQILQCINQNGEIYQVEKLDLPRFLVRQARDRGDIEGLILRDGRSVFVTDIQGRLIENYIEQHFPKPDQLLEIQGNVMTDTFNLVRIANPLVRNPDQYRYIEEPIVNKTFWDIIPRHHSQHRRAPNNIWTLRDYLKQRYTRRICVDEENRDYLAGFLLQWCLLQTTTKAWNDAQNNTLSLDVVIWQHALRILDDVFMFQDQDMHMINVTFHPFIRGFIDNPEMWKSEKYLDTGLLYLKLPDNDENDVLATTLRSHPNTYLIRLSPTRPMTLEFIRYTVTDLEKKGQASKLQDYVVFYRLNMLQNEYVNARCNGALVSLYHAMKHVYRQDDQGLVEIKSVDLFVLIMHLMQRKANAMNDPIYFAPVMTSFGTQWKNLQNVCNTPVYTDYNEVDYKVRWTEQLNDSKEAISWLLPIFTGVTATQATQTTETLLYMYTQYLSSEKYCETLFPSMDNFGDPGCRISKKWMIENVPDDTPNQLIANFYQHVVDFFYTGSLWECKLHKKLPFKKRVDTEDSSFPQRQQHIWHLMRWLGLNYFKTWSIARENNTLQNLPPWVLTVQVILRWLLRTGSAYPFATSEMADNMILALGDLGQKHGVVLRLSNSQVLGLQIRSHRPNPAYNPQAPYASKYLNETLSINQWGQWFRLPPLDFRELEFLIRMKLYEEKKAVLIRNLPIIRAFLESCNNDTPSVLLDIFKRVRKWTTKPDSNLINYIFLRATTEEDLQDIDNVVNSDQYRRYMAEWQKVRSLTVRVNDEGAVQGSQDLIGSLKQICAGGSQPKIDFSWLGNVNTPQCESEENWIFAQPLMSTAFIDKLINQYAKKDQSTDFLKNMKKLWQAMSKNPSWSQHWCNVGKRGNRNKTFMMNWLGVDTINYIADYAIDDQYNLQAATPNLPLKSPQQRLSFLTYQIFELLDDPAFDFFLTPPEQELLAYKYPGFLTVAMSGTKPGTLVVMGVDLDNLTQLIKDELDMENLLPYIPPTDSEITAIPLGLIIRLYLYDNYSMHIGCLKDPKEDDQTVCATKQGTVHLNPSSQLKATLLAYVNRIRFQEPVPSEYASRITSLVLSGAKNGSMDPNYNSKRGWLFTQAQYNKWFSKDNLRILEVHPNFARYLGFEAQGVVRGFGSDLWSSIRNIPNRLRTWAKDQFTFYENPTNWWYNTQTLEAAQFNVILIRLLAGDNLDQPEGYIGSELADLPNLQPTRIPSLLQKIEPPGLFEKSLIKKALDFRKKEFGGDAFETLGEKGYLQKIKEKLGISKDDKKQPQVIVGEDYTEILQAAQTAPPLVKSLLLAKQKSGLPFGPQETILAQKEGIIAPPAQPATKQVVSASAATGVAPPPGQRWILPAGPMSDSSGPPFQMMKGKEWENWNSPNAPDPQTYFARLNQDFEETETQACADNGPDYVFPAFDIDPNGNVVARCARNNWMMDNTHYSKTQFERLDPDNQKLLRAIANMAQHWCPTIPHQIKLWRWLGAGCLGRFALNYLAEEALQALNNMSSGPANPISTLREESMKDQLEMLQEFRTKVVSKASSKQPEIKCKKRIIFLTQMISSNILFPYIKDRKNALILSGYNPDKVVVMLGWSKSGSVHCMMTSSSGRGKPLEDEFQAEDIVNYMQYVPTTVRLRIFQSFYGGIAASNYLFYQKVLKDAKKNECIQSLGAMKRYAIRAALPKSYQIKLDQIYQQTRMTGGQVTEAQRLKLNEIQNVSLLLQAKNLTAQELYVFEEIMKLENAPPDKMKPSEVAEIAQRLYKSRDVDIRITEAENFENLALCQRPEFVPYLRKKLKEKYPEMKIADIEAMDRETLCRTLLNNPNLERLSLPVYLWQLDNVPKNLINTDTQLIALWDESKRDLMNTWLMKNYGVSLDQMRTYNQEYRKEEQVMKLGARKQEEVQAHIAQQVDLQDTILKFRQYLLDGGRCNFSKEDNTCQKMNFTDLSGNLIKLCDNNCDMVDVPAVTVMSLIFKNICDTKVPLLMNDFEFILSSFKALANYTRITTSKLPKLEKRLDKQCEQIQGMYVQYLKDLKNNSSNNSWMVFKLDSIETASMIKNMIHDYFNDDIRKLNPIPLKQIWMRFNETKPDKNQILAFTFTVLLYISFINGIIKLS